MFSSVPLVIAAVLAMRAWKRPLRLPLVTGLVAAALVTVGLILATMVQVGWL